MFLVLRFVYIPHGGVGDAVGTEQMGLPPGPGAQIGQDTSQNGLLFGPCGEHGCPQAMGVGVGARQVPPLGPGAQMGQV
ncbi:hypothetical protein A3D77_05170 [Candidatus Gottesmanbacteria bacterium RIFCSPHIGHO2_02_FULL_39_11]|uniref:Uncharacterized protein n=1 Tax=Candidatus Gottesmanbacteria bacterium RIFCSPHIGHO2_02_FULL_39_11 TaxID=1798382 RepID=A0A1F5ZNH8_9BACT|nr:MAG: hypothetical protein A3D77_05170 [Candidatus Gottesmanbacteria bacterium RIFCSPHIGHO2_02_FULL_39_11]